MEKNCLKDGKDLKVKQLKLSKMLMVDLIVILFHLKLDKFYCIGVMKQLKVISFFAHIKMIYYWFDRQELLQKTKNRYPNGGGKEETGEYYLKTEEF